MFAGPFLQAHLVALLDDPVVLRVAALHQAEVDELPPLGVLTALALHVAAHLLLWTRGQAAVTNNVRDNLS